MTRWLASFAAVLLLSACASRHAAEGHHNSPAYAAGYNDGCATATSRAEHETGGGEQRDEDLFKTSQDYRSGWRSGYASCNVINPATPLDNPMGNH